MKKRFEGKVAFVTGAASGIGRALTKELGALGAKVVAVDIQVEELQSLVAELKAAGVTARAEAIDVRDFAALESAVERTWTELGPIDYLFNNAGIGIIAMASDHTLDHWKQTLDTNVLGVVHGIEACYPRMIARGTGHIVNTASLGGIFATPGNIAYCASKAAVVALSESLRSEAATHGIEVTVVCPAAVRTPIFETSTFVAMDKEDVRKLLPGGSISAEECAHTILKGVVRNRAIVLPHVASVIARLQRFVPWLTSGVRSHLAGKFHGIRQARAA